MKTLKFTPQLTQLIKEGLKTTTFRLFDDKDLSVGDNFIMATRDGDKVTEFGKAQILEISIKTLGTLKPEDFVGHEPVTDDIVEHYKVYYGDKVSMDTQVKVIRYKILEIYH